MCLFGARDHISSKTAAVLEDEAVHFRVNPSYPTNDGSLFPRQSRVEIKDAAN